MTRKNKWLTVLNDSEVAQNIMDVMQDDNDAVFENNQVAHNARDVVLQLNGLTGNLVMDGIFGLVVVR